MDKQGSASHRTHCYTYLNIPIQMLATPCAWGTSSLSPHGPHRQTEPGSHLAERTAWDHSQHTAEPHKCCLIVLPRATPHTCSLSGCLCLASERTPSLPSCLGKFLIHHIPARYHLFSMASFLHSPGKEGFMAAMPWCDGWGPCTVPVSPSWASWSLALCQSQGAQLEGTTAP